MPKDEQSKFFAEQISGLSAVLLAVIRALEEGDALKREDVIAILHEFRNDMNPDELNGGEGYMIDRFLDELKNEKITRFEVD